MKRRWQAAALAALIAASLLAPARAVAADGTLHLFLSNGVRAVIEAVRPEAERSTGRSLVIEYGTTAGLRERIEAGAAFDAAILTSEAINELIQDRKLEGGTRTTLARCGIGVGIRAGAPKPDISTPDALVRTLLRARSIVYAKDGASRSHLEQLFEQFGIAPEMKAKTILEQGSARSDALVSEGQADLVLTLVSEILPAPGVMLVGPLPEPMQSYVNFAAGISAGSANLMAAEAFIRFLKTPEVAAVFRAKGMEPR